MFGHAIPSERARIEQWDESGYEEAKVLSKNKTSKNNFGSDGL